MSVILFVLILFILIELKLNSEVFLTLPLPLPSSTCNFTCTLFSTNAYTYTYTSTFTTTFYAENVNSSYTKRLTSRQAKGHSVEKRIGAVKLLERVMPMCQVQDHINTTVAYILTIIVSYVVFYIVSDFVYSCYSFFSYCFLYYYFTLLLLLLIIFVTNHHYRFLLLMRCSIFHLFASSQSYYLSSKSVTSIPFTLFFTCTFPPYFYLIIKNSNPIYQCVFFYFYSVSNLNLSIPLGPSSGQCFAA